MEMLSKKLHFKNIDFLKFVFAIFIVILHIAYWFNPYSPVLKNMKIANMNCVELFFIISGFMLVYTFSPKISTARFFIKKIIRLFPVLLFATTICFILSLFKILHFPFMDNVFALFFLNGMHLADNHTEIQGWGSVFPSWYVSVLVWVSLLYFYIIKSFGFKTFNILAWFVVFVGLYCLNYKVNIVINRDVLKALSSMAIGCILGQLFLIYETKITTAIYSLKTKIFYTLVEGGILGYLIYCISTTKSHVGMTDIMFLFSILFVLFILKIGYVSKLLDNKLSKQLGAYSYSVYMTHAIWIHIYAKFWFTPQNTDTVWVSWGGVTLSVIICVVFGILTHYVVEKPATKFVKRKYNL